MPVNKIAIFAIIGISILSGAILAFAYNNSLQSQQQQSSTKDSALASPVTEEEAASMLQDEALKLQEEAREPAARQIIYADARVQALTKDAYNHQIVNAYPAPDDGTEAILHVVQKKVITGDYKTGYVITTTGRTEVYILIDKTGQIVSYEEVPLPDNINKVTYILEEQKIIEKILANPAIQARFAEKGVSTDRAVVMMGGDIRVASSNSAIDCGGGNNALCMRANISINRDGNNPGTLTMIIDRNGEIANLSGWLS